MTTRRIADLAAATHVTVSARDENTGEEITIQLPIVRGSAGAPAVDISSLPAATGLYTLDPGFVATGSCRSAITFIDGPAGVLLHRGYGIDDLAAKSSYLEVVYLLLNNRLPASQRRLDLFTEEVIRRMSVDRRLESFMSGFPDDAHPMAVMVGTVGALSAFYHDCRGVKAMNESERALAAVRVVAKLPTIAAMAYRHSVGLPYVAPRRGKSFAANLLSMCFASPLDGGEFVAPPPCFEKALDVFLLLHADHEQNASTSTVRMAASSEANPFCVRGRGHRESVGPDARRRERGLYSHAARDRVEGSDPRVSRAGQGQERPVQAHGLWPSRLPEHRPAGEGDEKVGARLHRPVWKSTSDAETYNIASMA
jgi:citrate synthase